MVTILKVWTLKLFKGMKINTESIKSVIDVKKKNKFDLEQL